MQYRETHQRIQETLPGTFAHPDGDHCQNPVYMASLTAVLPEVLMLPGVD